MQDKIYVMKKMTAKQKEVALLIQSDIPVTKFPFQETGNICGLTGEEVLNITTELLQKGLIRKFGAILRHQKAGYGKNALVAWSVPAGQVQNTGKKFASFAFISHCYERQPAFRNKYNIFTMLHSHDTNYLSLVNEMAMASGINDYLILESVKEYKKTSPEYFK
jgi:siroheme decarboxylase